LESRGEHHVKEGQGKGKKGKRGAGLEPPLSKGTEKGSPETRWGGGKA